MVWNQPHVSKCLTKALSLLFCKGETEVVQRSDVTCLEGSEPHHPESHSRCSCTTIMAMFYV